MAGPQQGGPSRQGEMEMTVKEALREGLRQAMKAKEQVRLNAIRSAISEIQYEEIQKKVDNISDEDALAVLKREIKKRKEELEFAEKASRADLIESLKIEMVALETFLPRQLSEDELRGIIEKLKAENPSINLGVVMKSLKESYSGQYDAKAASDIARQVVG